MHNTNRPASVQLCVLKNTGQVDSEREGESKRKTDRRTDMERERSELAVLWRKLTIYTQNSKSRRVETNHSNGALASQ